MKKIENKYRSISKDSTIKDTIIAIQKNSIRAIAVVDDSKKFLGIITDGDIRRFILKEINLNKKIGNFLNKQNIFFMSPSKNINFDKLKDKFIANKLLHLPVTDKNKKFINLYSYEELFNNYSSNYDVVIMSGGEGKRLKPLTNKTPKPLININGKPMIDIIIEELNSQGFKNFYITINFLGSRIVKHLNLNYKNSLNKFIFIKEKKKLGTAGALFYMKKQNIKNDFVVYNCDVISKINLKKIIDFHKKNKFDMTIATINYDQNLDYGVIKKSIKNRLIKIDEKPDLKFEINAGIYIINSKSLKFITSPKYLDMNQFINILIKKKSKIGVYNTNEFWIDVGNHSSLNLANKSLSE